jgi:hypothetical protein
MIVSPERDAGGAHRSRPPTYGNGRQRKRSGPTTKASEGFRVGRDMPRQQLMSRPRSPSPRRTNWTYDWTPGSSGDATIKVRAARRQRQPREPRPRGNRRRRRPDLSVLVWDNSVTPPTHNDLQAIELGVNSAATRTASSPASGSTRVREDRDPLRSSVIREWDLLAEAQFTGTAVGGDRRRRNGAYRLTC